MPTAAPTAPISWGELIDKITILQIKSEHIASDYVRKELALLSAIAAPVLARADVAALTGELKAINAQLWEIEDRIRDKEAAKSFDEDFIALARSVYRNNDARGAVKRKINLALESELMEEKSYKDY